MGQLDLTKKEDRSDEKKLDYWDKRNKSIERQSASRDVSILLAGTGATPETYTMWFNHIMKLRED
jgi:hypothetical protein